MITPASPEEVYSREYWEPVPPAPEILPKGGTLWLTKAIAKAISQRPPSIEPKELQDAEDALNMAVHLLRSGEPIEPIDEGEPIGGSEDRRYALPGAVLLIDHEFMVFDGNGEREPEPALEPEAVESICVSGTACLMQNSINGNPKGDEEDGFEVIRPYFRKFKSPDIGSYGRWINLYSFCQAADGSLAGLPMISWRNEPDNPNVSLSTTGRYTFFPPEVGVTVNSATTQNNMSVVRIRDARLCIAGTREYAREVVKERRRKLSLVPSLSPLPTV